MQQAVVVIRTQGGEALVRGRRASACGGCAGKASCGTLGSWFERFAEMRVANPVHARTGDEVIVEVPDSEFLRAALRLYGMPMLGFFAAGFAARALAVSTGFDHAELVAALAALTGMAGVFLRLRATDRSRSNGARIVSITSQGVGIPVFPQA